MIKFWRARSSCLEQVVIKTHIQILVVISNLLQNNQIILAISKTRLMPNLKKITSRLCSRESQLLDSKIRITQIQIWISSIKVFKALLLVLLVVKNQVLRLLKRPILGPTRDAWWLDHPHKVVHSKMKPIWLQLIQGIDPIQGQLADHPWDNPKWIL